MTDYAEEIRDLHLTVGALSTSVVELLTWAEDVERLGAIPPGTFEKAQKVVELGKVHVELDMVKESIHNLESLTMLEAPTLLKRLHQRVSTLRSRKERLAGEIHGS